MYGWQEGISRQKMRSKQVGYWISMYTVVKNVTLPAELTSKKQSKAVLHLLHSSIVKLSSDKQAWGFWKPGSKQRSASSATIPNTMKKAVTSVTEGPSVQPTANVFKSGVDWSLTCHFHCAFGF